MAINSQFVEKDDFGKSLCKVLKLDPDKTRSISIQVYPDDVVIVQVGQYLLKDEGKEILVLLKEYNLVKNDTTDELTSV